MSTNRDERKEVGQCEIIIVPVLIVEHQLQVSYHSLYWYLIAASTG